MPAFWILFWISFYLTPIAYALSQGSKSSGWSSSGSHIWVFKGSNTKVRDATRKEVWERRHPGKKWSKAQERNANLFLAFLLVILFFALMIFAENALPLPEGNYQRHLNKGGATILGIILSAVYWPLVLTFVWEMKSLPLRIFRWIALAVGPLLVIAFTALTLRGLENTIPISHHWIWVSPVLVALLGYIDKTHHQQRRDSALKGGNKLGFWALDMMRRRLLSAGRST